MQIDKIMRMEEISMFRKHKLLYKILNALAVYGKYSGSFMMSMGTNN